MKTVSKWIASLLAIVMVLSLSSVPSFAASTTFYYDGPTVRCPNFQYTDGTNAAPALMQFEDDYGTTYQAYCLDRNTLVTPTFYENTDVSGLGNLFGSNSDIQINQIRKILSESYPITSVPDIAANAGLSADAITLQDVVAATQMAIWAVINSSGLPVSLSSDLTSPTTILYNYLMQNLGNGYSAADLQEVFTNGAISVSYDYISGLTNWSDAVAGPYVLTANNYYPALLQGYGFDLGGAAGVYIVDQNNNVLTQVQVGQPFFVRFDDLTACNTANITFSGSASFPSGVILMRGQNGAGTQPVVAINSETLPVSTFLNVKIDISQGGGDTGGGDTGGGDTGGGNQNTTQQVPVYSGAQTGWGGWVTNTATFPMYDKKVGNNSYNGVTRSGSSAWAMAIQFAGADKTVDLVVGQNTVAGSVTLHNAGGGKMTVTYNPFSPLSATDKNILTSINCGIYPTIAKIPNGNGQLMNAGGTITKNADGTTTV
ncbi:MAG: thioester domain-containing protein, partial [Firmicutes bacterium]|nr:thioester domain-containing protein [Bacillota bacterium]